MMTRSEIAKVLTDLASGVNPVSGERLPEQSPYHDPHVIRALFSAVQHLVLRHTRADQAGGLAERAGQPWTAEEDARLAREFDGRTKISAIARAHGRTRGAILARLIRLGKLVARNQVPASLQDERPDRSRWAEIKTQRSQAGKPWTSEDDAVLLKHFAAGMVPEEIAKQLRRGVHAIEVRLCKLGRLSPGVSGGSA